MSQVFPLCTDKVQYSSSPAVAVCTTTDCTLSAFKLINALCVGSVENVRTLQELLTQLFYSGMHLFYVLLQVVVLCISNVYKAQIFLPVIHLYCMAIFSIYICVAVKVPEIDH